jgi:hypothetical protein
MAGLAAFFRNPFSFLFARSTKMDRIAAYLVREHERGRSLDEILEDPYVRNRATPEELARLLDRPELIRALGDGVVTTARSTL